MPEQRRGRVTVEENVVIGTGGDRDLKVDVYTPPADLANGAGVLLIHGGSWRNGDRTQLRGYGILLGRIGYTCVGCEYRLAGEGKWPAQIHDAKAALRWMRANAARLNIDPAKIAVSGNSAGGHLSLMIAGTRNMPEFEGVGGNAGVNTEVAACIAFYAPALLGREGVEPNERVRFLFGPDATHETVTAASPITHASASFPPTMLLSGNKDETVPVESSLRMYDALVAVGAKAELHIYEGAPHAFDRIPEFGRQTATIMALFLDRQMVNPRGFVMPQATAAPA